MKRNLPALLGAILVMAIAVFISQGFGSGDDEPFAANPDSAGESSPDPAADHQSDSVDESSVETGADSSLEPEADTPPPRFSTLPSIDSSTLPPEAIDTLRLIADGGPYPYRQDDGVFQNREGILPQKPEGHYREYTVDTPGSDDRGARRIVAGDDGELFYTSDHYDSFLEVVAQ